MSNLNNLALQLVQILNQHTNDGGPQGILPTNHSESANKLLLEQYNSYFLPYLSRTGNESLLSNLCNQPNTSVEQLLTTYSSGTGFPINTFLNFEQNGTRKFLPQNVDQQNQALSKQNLDPTNYNSALKSTQFLLNLQQGQTPILGLHSPMDVSRSQPTNSSSQQVIPMNLLNSGGINSWAESTLSSLLDKPDMLMNLMRLGAASIMASYYGQSQNSGGTNILQQNSPFLYNMALSPKQVETPCMNTLSPLEVSTSSSLAYTPVKSPPTDPVEHQTPIFASNNMNQQFSDELIFYNFLEQSRKLSYDIKSQGSEKKSATTNKNNGSSIRKSCAGRPRLDRSDWCCSLCRCIETAQWRYLRNTLENNSNNICHRGKILVCNACYLRVSKENKIRQKVNTFQMDGNLKLDET